MASLVSSLKQSLSLGRDSQFGSTPRSGSIPSSPSFSDFSLGVEHDAEHELSRKARKPTDSMAKQQTLDASSTWASMFGNSAPRDIPKAQEFPPQALNHAHSMAPDTPRRRPEGKIGGMSYYDYHDLIRSSSL